MKTLLGLALLLAFMGCNKAIDVPVYANDMANKRLRIKNAACEYIDHSSIKLIRENLPLDIKFYKDSIQVLTYKNLRPNGYVTFIPTFSVLSPIGFNNDFITIHKDDKGFFLKGLDVKIEPVLVESFCLNNNCYTGQYVFETLRVNLEDF